MYTPKNLPVKISDLLDIIHLVIIKEVGENEVILGELEAIDNKIKAGLLPDFDVTNHPFWMTIENERSKHKLDLRNLTTFTQGASYWVYDVTSSRIVSVVYDEGYFDVGYAKLKAISVKCQKKPV